MAAAGRAVVSESKEKNPFTLPSDEDMFLSRERSRAADMEVSVSSAFRHALSEPCTAPRRRECRSGGKLGGARCGSVSSSRRRA